MSVTGFRLGTTQSQISGSWSNPTNVLAEDDSAATDVIAAKNTTHILEVGSFGFDGVVPAGCVITKVELRVRGSVSSASNANYGANARVTTTDLTDHTRADTALTTMTYDITAERAWTRADLLDGTLKVRCNAEQGNTSSSRTYSFAWVEIQVTYEGPFSGSGGVTFSASLAASGSQTFSGTGAVAFGIAVSGSGEVSGGGFTGDGGVTFTASLAGQGSQTFAASGGVAFGAAFDGTGTQAFSGSGGVAFGIALDGAGGQTFSASGGVTFSAALSGSGGQAFAGSGGVAFGAALAGDGTVTDPSDVTGSGGVSFGASISGTGLRIRRPTGIPKPTATVTGRAKATATASAHAKPTATVTRRTT